MNHLGGLTLLIALEIFAGLSLGGYRLRVRNDKEHLCEAAFLWLFLQGTLPLDGWWSALTGVVFGASYSARMLTLLRLPRPVSALLACSQTLLWTLFAVGANRLGHATFPLNVLLIASFGTFLLWLEWTLLPLWGTAQNFACSSPTNRPFIAWFGAAGGTWSLLLISAFASAFCSALSESQDGHYKSLLHTGISFLFFALAALIVNTIFSRPKKPQPLRVATFGWAGTSAGDLAEFQNAARDAHEKGARLLVTPEAAIHVQNRANFRVTLCTLALKYDLALAVGYFDNGKNENCIDFISARGEVVGRYVKTHLVPMMERYTKGSGEIALMDVDGIKIGGLVCQDDNFPDIARRYARAGAQLLVVPTNDWARVKNIHFANHLWRSLEFRFALARAASEGISALTSFDGKVETSSDHFNDGTKLLVADVRVGSGKPTLYAKSGDWFPVACGLAAIAGLWFAR